MSIRPGGAKLTQKMTSNRSLSTVTAWLLKRNQPDSVLWFAACRQQFTNDFLAKNRSFDRYQQLNYKKTSLAVGGATRLPAPARRAWLYLALTETFQPSIQLKITIQAPKNPLYCQRNFTGAAYV